MTISTNHEFAHITFKKGLRLDVSDFETDRKEIEAVDIHSYVGSFDH